MGVRHGEWPQPDGPYRLGTEGTIYDGSDPAAAYGIGGSIAEYREWEQVVGEQDVTPWEHRWPKRWWLLARRWVRERRRDSDV